MIMGRGVAWRGKVGHGLVRFTWLGEARLGEAMQGKVGILRRGGAGSGLVVPSRVGQGRDYTVM